MAFIFTCGSHKFKKQIKGAEHLTFQCANCHNFSAKPITDWLVYSLVQIELF